MTLKLSVCLIYVLQTHCTSFFSLVLCSCCCSMAKLCAMLCGPMKCSMWGFLVLDYLRVCSNSCSLSQWCHLTILSCQPLRHLPSIFTSIRVFSNESALLIRWPKYWSFSFCISPPNEYSGLISLELTGLISLQSKGLSRVFFSTTIWNHQFFSTQRSLRSNSHHHKGLDLGHTWITYWFSLFSSI